MHFETGSHYSGHLGQEMGYNRYGHSGVPVIVFPSSGGSKDEFADFGMINALNRFIEEGKIQVFTPESYDSQSWLNEHKSAHDQGQAHNAYDRYIIGEFLPHVRHLTGWQGKVIATGASMGGFHTMNFALRHPDVFGVAIALSGVYDARFFTDEFGGDMSVYENSPIDYIWNMEDPWFLDQYRQNHYIICVGQGAWEGPHVLDTRRLETAFDAKSIPAWFDYWGPDVPHDWDAWRDQIYYFFNELDRQGII
ncbi:esterase family protein [Hutsoniella sourekii]|uniref:esterase family protein n=1 Tax=Hutsoniella sourekii TaxID=87650 RepID=UPI000483D37D|nr:alpha/beta hydrolase-fold protein [Hutsoniella sourekii]